jgi:hypothetical protein
MSDFGIYILVAGVAIFSIFTRLHVMRLERKLDRLVHGQSGQQKEKL